jgi:hypothetical protein
MKIILVSSLIVLSLPGFSQKDSLVRFTATPRTSFGKPAGEKTSSTIGPEGGIIQSADSLAILEIPAGAVPAATIISIQPVTNMARGGRGHSYDFNPAGLQFSKPALLTLRIPPSEKKPGPALPQGIAWQDSSGYWHRVKGSRHDTLRQLVSAPVSHFSGYGRQLSSSLEPETAELHVNESQGFVFDLHGLLPDRYQNMVEEEDMSYEDVIKKIPATDIEWTVNDIPAGNDIVGRLLQNHSNPLIAVYFAPNTVPSIDPVQIKAHLKGTIHLAADDVATGVNAMATVSIVDEFRYTFIGYSKQGVLDMIDSSSCNIKVIGRNVSISGIQNYPVWSDWPARAGGCTYTYPNKAAWKGLVEITGMAYGVVNSGGTNPVGEGSVEKLTHVMISLLPALGNTPMSIAKCPGQTSTVPSMTMPAMPQSIEFDMNHYDVTIHFGGESAKNELNRINNGHGFIIRIERIYPGY